ncbi:MAG: UDP-N-acetylmuramoyl-L-alanine--D-glutamate ligase, partial [Gemmatimonadota bacterium]|nr:UDP-N-acetylmuramoyl-L-alanine--D-glutamate ligase [Gemmatimonadota bacterium]
MTLADWMAAGREIAVIGLGASGVAATRLLRARGVPVYASDAGSDPDLGAVASGLRQLGAVVELGRHDMERIARSGGVVVSPGVPPDAAPVRAARDAGVPVRAEADLGLEVLEGVPWVAITGTNGKTTTTAMVAHLLAADGRYAVAAGNIGTPVTAVALEDRRPDWMAVELSSFQLHDCHGHRPTVGILTNLSPDHLDRYPGIEAYYADKARLFLHATAASTWVLNQDDAPSVALVGDAPGRRILVSVQGRADAWYDRAAGQLVVFDHPVMPRGDLALLGDHNVANALMAAAAATVAGVGPEALAERLRSFRALAHRLEPVGTVDDVIWINDSKATNIASTEVALAAM